MRHAVNNPQQSQGDVSDAAAELVWLLFNEPQRLFKASVSHCDQEVTISRTRDHYCHRVCL